MLRNRSVTHHGIFPSLKLAGRCCRRKRQRGRGGEVVYAIDGVPMTDVYDGSNVIDVNPSTIQELEFVSGAFNAEYGRALSGYVNIATKMAATS